MFSSSTSPFGATTTGQGLFGTTQQQPAATGSLFGAQQQQPAATTGGLFGATTQNNPTTSPLGTGGLFGQQQQTGGGLFGGTANTGGGLFGQQQPQQQTSGGFFGGSGTNTATTGTTGGGLFGNTTGFGQPQQQQPQQQGGLFGNTTGFGQQQQQPTTGGGLFGGSTTTGFGQPQQQQSGSLFGSTTATPAAGGGLFGSSSTGFGQPQQQQQQGGLFGSSTSTGGGGLFGQPQQQQQQPSSGLFGSNTQQTGGGGGLFGVTNSANAPGQTTSPFGVPATGQQQQEPFKPFRSDDGSVMTICHGPLEKVCLEEIRWNFYQQNGKGPGAPAAASATPASTGGGLFGAPSTTQGTGSAFGGGGLFGSSNNMQQPAAAGGLFGNAAATGTQNAFGGGGGLFGSTAPQQQQQQQGGLFGNTTAAAPATGGGLFGNTTGSTAAGGLFGKPATGTGFGASNALGNSNTGGGLFGSSTANTGGGLFGGNTNTATTGGGLFGQQQQPQQQQQQQQQQQGGGLFGGFGTGATAANAGQTNTGGGLFGSSLQPQQQQQGGLLGGGSNLFGAKPAAGGATNTTGGGTGLFGSSSSNALGGAGGGLFGSSRPAGTTGTGALGSSSTGGGLFGSSAATGNAAANTGGGGLFGNLGKTTGGTGGGLFGSGASTNTGGGLFGSSTSLLQQQPQQQQQGGLFGLSCLGGGQQQQQQQQPLLGGSGAPSGSTLLGMGGLLGAPPVTVQIVLSATTATPTQFACSPVSSVGDSCCLGGPPPVQLRQKTRRFLPALPAGGGALSLSLTQATSGLGASLSLPPQLLQRQQQQLLPARAADSSMSRNGWLAQTIHRSLAAAQQQQRQPLLPLSPLDYQLLHRLQDAAGGPPRSPTKRGEESAHGAGAAEETQDGSDEQQQQQQQRQQQQDTLSVAAAAAAAAAAEAAASSTCSNSSSGEARSTRAPIELRPVLTNPQYECIPSIASLQQMSEEELRRVRDFIIRRPGYGSILFPGHTDLRGINLDLVVHIDHLEVSVYADEAPPVGVGLNKRAQVTLCNCKPKISQETGDDGKGETDEAATRTEQFVAKVKRYTEKMGAKFLSLDQHTWDWRFEVDHFSVYKWIDEEAATDSEEVAEAAQVAAFAAFAPAAVQPKELVLHAQRTHILRAAPQALLAAVAHKQQQEHRAADAALVGEEKQQSLLSLDQKQHQQEDKGAAATPHVEDEAEVSELSPKNKDADETGETGDAPGSVVAKPAASPPHSWLKHPLFPVRCAPSLGPGGLCALPIFRAPTAAAGAGAAAGEGQGAYEVALLRLSPLLPPAAAPRGFVWPQPFAREAAEAISTANAAADTSYSNNTRAPGAGEEWTAGEVPRSRAVQHADPLEAEGAVETAARDYVICSSQSNTSKDSNSSSSTMRAASLEEEGVRVLSDLKRNVRLHLFDSGVSVHRGLAATAAVAAVGVVFEALRDTEGAMTSHTEELHFRLKLMQQQSQQQQQAVPTTSDVLQRLLVRMLQFLQQQSNHYAGDAEAGPWPPASPWVPSAAAAALSITSSAGDDGESPRYSETSYLSPYMAQTWRLLVRMLVDSSEQHQQQLQQLLQEGPNKDLNVSVAGALERRRQLGILDWLLEEGRPLVLSFLRRARVAAALQEPRLQPRQQLFLSCNARALAEAARTKGELRRFVALLHLVANGQGLAAVHLLLRGGAFYPHLALAVAAHLQQPLGHQLLYADALQASALPQPPQEVRRVYRLLAGAPPPRHSAEGADSRSSGKLRCLQTTEKDAKEAKEAGTRTGAAVPATSGMAGNATEAAMHAALWGEDSPFLDWRAELGAALLFSRETAVLYSPPHIREELRPPPQASDAPRDLKRALLFVEGFGRGRRCSCSSCWGSAPLPLYVHQQQQAQSLQKLLGTPSQQQQQDQHIQKLLSEEQFDMQFALLRQHAGLTPPSLAAVGSWRCTPFPLDVQLSWLVGLVLCMHFCKEAAKQQQPLVWLPDGKWVASLPAKAQPSIRRLLQQQHKLSVSFAEQLEFSGMWPVACGVLLLSPDRDAGVLAARSLIERYGRELSAEVSVHRRLWATEVLHQQLGIPRSWLQRAQANFLQFRGRYLQAAFLYLDGYRHAAAPPEGFLESPAGRCAWTALKRHFPVQQEQQELLLAAAGALLKALPSFLQGLLLVLQHRQQQILLHGWCHSNAPGRQAFTKPLQRQQDWESAAAADGSSSLSPEEQMELLLEAIALCCSQQMWPQQQEKLRCCRACIQWMQQEFALPSAPEAPTRSAEDREAQQQLQQQQRLHQQLTSLLHQHNNCTDAERKCWASMQSALTEAREQQCH